jgi:hypothetical protein
VVAARPTANGSESDHDDLAAQDPFDQRDGASRSHQLGALHAVRSQHLIYLGGRQAQADQPHMGRQQCREGRGTLPPEVIPVAMRKGREPSQGLEALAWYSQFDKPPSGTGTTVQDLARRQAAVDRLKAGMDESLANKSRLHGWRVQGLFEALMVCLGSVQLIVMEDAGAYYYDDSHGNVKPPDFRVVRADGQQALIEVKNVDPRTPGAAPINEKDFEQKQRYADLMGTRLLLAHYWSAFNQWSIVDASVSERRNGKLVLPVESAMKANELGLMGDSMIATRPPLTISIIADPSSPQAARQITPIEDQWRFTIEGVEVSCAGQTLTSPLEKRIAWFLALYGNWDVTRDVHLDDAGHITRVDLQTAPPVADEEYAAEVARQGFAVVGNLSEMYSAYYNSMTLTDTGEVGQLRHEPEPGVLADLIPADYWSSPSRDLPIWRFRTHPSLGPRARSLVPLPCLMVL